MSEIKRGNVPDAAREEVSRVLTRLGLTLNKAKTKQGDLWQEAVTFLVFESRMCRSARTGRAFPVVTLSAKALTRIRHVNKEQTTRRQYARCRPAAVMAAFNQQLRGWVQYFTMAIALTRSRSCAGTWLPESDGICIVVEVNGCGGTRCTLTSFSTSGMGCSPFP